MDGIIGAAATLARVRRESSSRAAEGAEPERKLRVERSGKRTDKRFSEEAFLAGERLTPSEPTEGASGKLSRSAPPISQVKRTEGAIAVRSLI
jgi:hypothetical protein